MPAQPFFTPELFAFLRQLKRNNNREWFAKNKARYQQFGIDAAMAFIEGFAPHLAKISPHFVADARPVRGSLFRIYRDTRFAPDGAPYKTHLGIHFSHEKGKDVHAPLFYLHLEPGGCFAAAGVWHPDNKTLTTIRSAIVAAPEQWKQATRRLELEGDSLSRPPKGFCGEHPLIEDLKRKDYVVSAELTEAQVCGPKLMPEFAKACGKMAPLVKFTTEALGLRF
jgi:uncharacterized protein (TIGR02453 family)